MIAEWLAVVLLSAKGYRLVGRRVKTHVGEIDLVVSRGRRLAFIEVKWRPTLEAAQSSIGGAQRRRIRRAADNWLARNRRFASHDISFDVVLVMPWKLPQHIVGGL
ncbi:MAG: YraN family protein [Hyphomicrobiaceae bacterium]